MTIDLSPRCIVTRWVNGAPIYTVAVPTPFGKARADAIWASRGIQWTLAMTDGEIAYVDALWATMDGDTHWLNAFWSIQQGDTP